jgi:hypothetical protein
MRWLYAVLDDSVIVGFESMGWTAYQGLSFPFVALRDVELASGRHLRPRERERG